MRVDICARLGDATALRVAVQPVGDTPAEDFEYYLEKLRAFSHIKLSELHSTAQDISRPTCFQRRGSSREGRVEELGVQLNIDASQHLDEWAGLQPHKEVVAVIGLCCCSDFTDLPAAHAAFVRAASAHRFARHGTCYRLYVFEPAGASANSPTGAGLQHVVVIPTEPANSPAAAEQRLAFYLRTQLQDLANQVRPAAQSALGSASPVPAARSHPRLSEAALRVPGGGDAR